MAYTWPYSVHLSGYIFILNHPVTIEMDSITYQPPPVTEAGGGGLRRAAKTNLNIGLD